MMSWAVGSACNIKGNTPGPPPFTSHTCAAFTMATCRGFAALPILKCLEDHEMRHVCRTCVRSRKSKGSSRLVGSGAEPKRQSLQGDKGKGKARTGGKAAEVIN